MIVVTRTSQRRVRRPCRRGRLAAAARTGWPRFHDFVNGNLLVEFLLFRFVDPGDPGKIQLAATQDDAI